MTQSAIKTANRYSFIPGDKTPVNKNESTKKPLCIGTTNIFNAAALPVSKSELTIVIPEEKKKVSYLATKRNLLLVTIVYTIVLGVVLGLVL